MKKTILLFTVMAYFVTMQTNATVWRVSNRIINGVTVDADLIPYRMQLMVQAIVTPFISWVVKPVMEVA